MSIERAKGRTMSIYWYRTLAAALIALGAQGVAAQPMIGCPAGEAMQSSSPSGKTVTCVPVELKETDIVGRWAMTGTTLCLQSTSGFHPTFLNPLTPTVISQLQGTVSAVRTFKADGTGSSTGVTQSISMPPQGIGMAPAPGNTGGPSLADLNANFTWGFDADGRLVIDDDNLVPQKLLLPTTRAGFTVTIHNVPSFVGYVSKDKKTIVLTHATVALETSVLSDPNGNVIATTPRFCTRERVLTRLAD